MEDHSLGADLVGPERLPRVTLSPLLGTLAALPPAWITLSERDITLDVARALDGTKLPLRVLDVERHDTAVLGGHLDADDVPAAGEAARALRRTIEQQLDALPYRALPPPPSPTPALRDLRFSRARFESVEAPPRHNALVVWSSREEFPERRSLCDLIDRAVRRHLGDDVADRFVSDLPYRENPEAARRSRSHHQFETFLQFLQEHGMARVRGRVAFWWMKAIAKSLPESEQRSVLRFIVALEAIVEAASRGTEFQEASLDGVGVIRPRGWATTTFVSGLPLVPRADCEYAEGSEGDGDRRRGPEATEATEAPSGRPEEARVRHVTWLPRFNASGPDPVNHLDGRHQRTTTLTSRALLLERALLDGVFAGRVPSREGERFRILRALEYHIVVRAAQLAADGAGRPGEAAVELVQKMLAHLDDGSRRAAALSIIVRGYRHDEGKRRAVEPRIEAWSKSFATHAGHAAPTPEKISFRLCLDRSLFAVRSVSPLIAARAHGDAGAGPPWAWTNTLSVHEGHGESDAAMTVCVGVTLEAKVLRWAPTPEKREAHRIDDDPVVVVLDRRDGDARDAKRRQLYESDLAARGRHVTVVLPRLPRGDAKYAPDDGGLDAASRGPVVAASILTSAAVVAAVRRLDPGGERSVRIVTAFDASLDVYDSCDDVVLRAVGRALRGAFVDRAVIAQGGTLSSLEDTRGDGAHRRAAMHRAAKRGAAVRFAVERARELGAPIGVVVLAGRPVDCVRERSGEAVVADDGHDVLWGTAYLARFEDGTVTVRDVGRVHAVLQVAEEWPAPILALLQRFRDLGCAEVALVSHRAHERRTWRSEARNRFYDGELPIELLARQPECAGLRFVSLLCDTITAVAANPTDGVRSSQGRLIVADGAGLYPNGVLHGLRPIVAVATNRTPRQVVETDRQGQRRIGLRRSVHVYIQRRRHEEQALDANVEARIADAIVGIHLLEGESDYDGMKGQAPLLVPVLRPHKAFEVVRRVDASEIVFQDGHARTWLNLLGFGVVTRSLMRDASR